jgi:alkanesulfonate monooxygenase SsuD/methylene tetrahydromethanopterin reductase-like flavin-dependent oxidoreductase (luciferase family)
MADLASGGRVEIIFGRDAFNDNFPLFGFDMKDYDALFAEKQQLFELLNANERVTWPGKLRPALQNAEIAPRPHQPKLPVSIGALSQGSVGRAAKIGYPLVIAVLGGTMEGYADIAAYYRAVWAQSGRRQEDAKIALFSHFHVTETTEQTEQDFYPYYSAYLRPMYRQGIPTRRGACGLDRAVQALLAPLPLERPPTDWGRRTRRLLGRT